MVVLGMVATPWFGLALGLGFDLIRVDVGFCWSKGVGAMQKQIQKCITENRSDNSENNSSSSSSSSSSSGVGIAVTALQALNPPPHPAKQAQPQDAKTFKNA